MQSVLFAPDPRILGNAYGFFEFNDNGQRVIGHSGSGEPMESMLLLLPDENLGVFVAYNSLAAGELNRQHFGFQRAFFDHYNPEHKSHKHEMSMSSNTQTVIIIFHANSIPPVSRDEL